MKMVLTVQSARIYGKVLSRGDEFDVPEKEARLWAALARAKLAPENVAPRYNTAAVSTDDVPTHVDSDRREERRRDRYNRRDMRAKE